MKAKAQAPNMTTRFLWALLAFTGLAILLARPALGATETQRCSFIEKKGTAGLLSRLPDEMVGLVNCPDKYDLNTFYVARFKQLDAKKLKSFFDSYEETMLQGVDGNRIVHETKGPKGLATWQEIETKRGPLRSAHHLFTKTLEDGQTLVYLYTDTTELASKYRERILKVGRSLQEREFSEIVKRSTANE